MSLDAVFLLLFLNLMVLSAGVILALLVVLETHKTVKSIADVLDYLAKHRL